MTRVEHRHTGKTDWETPPEFFAQWDAFYRFQLDVCATRENAKCDLYFTPQVNGLLRPWAPYRCWMNPPYGKGIVEPWIEKAYQEARAGAVVVCLLPSRTDTLWFHEFYPKATQTHFVKGRIKFVGAEDGAAFPSLVMVFDYRLESRG